MRTYFRDSIWALESLRLAKFEIIRSSLFDTELNRGRSVGQACMQKTPHRHTMDFKEDGIRFIDNNAECIIYWQRTLQALC